MDPNSCRDPRQARIELFKILLTRQDQTELARYMSNHAKAAIAGLLVAIPWGWFTDLAAGQYGWFFGRLIVVPALAYATSVLVSRARAK